MKDQQLSNEPAQSSDTTPAAAPAEDHHHLPPEVYREALSVQPRDAQTLAYLLNQYPEMTRQILAVVSSRVGASTVREAIELRREGVSVPTQKDFLAGGAAELEGDPPASKSGVAVKQQGPMAEHQPTPAEASAPVAASTKAPAHAEPAWVTRARKYNLANPTLVDEFNDLTNFKCTDGDSEHDPNPVEIARWQRTKGLTADGMIGPHSIAAARPDSAKDKDNQLANIHAMKGEARSDI